MKITSPAFLDNQYIPNKYSAYDANLSPPLEFDEIPNDCASLALIMEDPDAPSFEPFQHWLVWNIPPAMTKFHEGEVPAECRQGMNDSRRIGYYGPRPPSGVHKYIFNLIAVDIILDLKSGSTGYELENSLLGHKKSTAKLTGLFSPNS